MKRLVDFLSPWALAGVALWIVLVGMYVNWAIPQYTNVGEGPGIHDVPVGAGVDVVAVVLFAIGVATTITVCLVGIVLLVRRISHGAA